MLSRMGRRLSFWIVLLPMVVAAFYYVFLASNRYVSESIVTVRQSGESAVAAVSGIAALLGGNSASREETLFLQAFIHSLDMLKHLEGRFAMRKAYEAPKSDPLYRLYPDASQEWFHWYYRNRVEVLYDDVTGLLTIRTEGFDPDFARAVNAEILSQSERFVNEISHRLARDQMAFAESELRRSSERFQAAKARLVAFQNRHKMFDPLAQVQAATALTAQLEAEVVRKEAELTTALGFLQDNTPQVVALRNEITALRRQLDIEQQKITSGPSGKLTNLAAEFHNLSLEVGFAEDAYKAALGAVETTRIDASRKIKTLVIVESPAKPETAQYPMRLYNLATLLVALVLLYGIVRLVLATIRDHRD